MPKSVYGEASVGEQDIPIAALAGPINHYNMRISTIIGQLLNITKEDDKKIVIERLRLIREEMALTVANSRSVDVVPPHTASQANRGLPNKGSRS